MPLQATSGAASYDAFGGGVPVTPVYIEDVMSVWLYTGNGSTQTITNGIDLAGEGGLVWIKNRNSAYDHYLANTAVGIGSKMASNTTAASVLDFSLSTGSSGFSISASGPGTVNETGQNFASWTFRKAPKFFDVVTYTGNGANRNIAHSLGSVPGCIIVKSTDTSADWQVYHRSNANTQYMVLNRTAAVATGTTRWNSTTPTDTVFSLGTDTTVNASGSTYVAYLFAHDAGGFGLEGTDNVISCGSFTTDGSGNATVNLGYEPQWVLIKQTNAGSNWMIHDSMRGMSLTTYAELSPNISNAENAGVSEYVVPQATGFKAIISPNNPFIYIAIRRGPMKVPTDGTKVFQAGIYTGNAGFPTITTGSNSISDLVLFKPRTTTSFNDYIAETALTRKRFFTNSPDMEGGPEIYEYLSNGFSISNSLRVNASGVPYVYQAFRRAPKFADVVCWTNSAPGQSVSHNLAAAPELILVKRRQNSEDWQVYAATLGASAYLVLNSTAAAVTGNTNRWNGTSPTASVFTTGGYFSSEPYIAYLFASCPGVSKVGSYTGNGSSQTIDCGFTGGARFVMVKRTNSTGNWLVVDTARGLVSAGDPTLYLNSTAQELLFNDWIDPDSSGFIVNQVATTNANVSGSNYIFLAIA